MAPCTMRNDLGQNYECDYEKTHLSSVTEIRLIGHIIFHRLLRQTISGGPVNGCELVTNNARCLANITMQFCMDVLADWESL